MRDGRVAATVEPVSVRDVEGDHFTLGAADFVDLSTFDVVLLRQDPPFDLAYITTTHLLERIHPEDPGGQRPGQRAQRAGEALRHRVPRPQPADPDHPRPRAHRRLPRGARRHHHQAALWRRRRRRLPHLRRRREPAGAARNVRGRLPRALRRPALSPRGAPGRQAHHPGRGRTGRHHQPRAGGRRGALQHACRRPRGSGRDERHATGKSAPRSARACASSASPSSAST